MSAPRALVNQRRRPERVPAPPGDEVLRFHRGLAGYEPTPLRAVDYGGIEALVKDESNRFGLPAFKILGASWAVERTLRERPDLHTLVAASAGNHGRAVARVAAWRGLRCRIYLPARAGAARADAIAAEGAEVVRVDGGYEDAVAAAERAGRERGVANLADVSDDPAALTPAWASEGYSTLFREIDRPLELLLVPVGVGSLAAAALRFGAHADLPFPVVGVEPVTAACVTASLAAGEPVSVETPGTAMAGLDCARPSAVAWPVLRDGLAGTVTVSDEEVDRWKAAEAFGECGLAPIAALHALAHDDACAPLAEAVGYSHDRTVALVATEGITDPKSYHRAR